MENDKHTSSLDAKDKETLRQWLREHTIRDAQGNAINHRIWFKNMFNPFLRSMGWVIATKVDDNGNPTGYIVRKYSK